MEFPIYRKRKCDQWMEFVMIAGDMSAILVTQYSFGDGSIEHSTTEESEEIQGNYVVESTAAEFTAAYEAVQEKIKQAVNA